jgi:hypothetical protein
MPNETKDQRIDMAIDHAGGLLAGFFALSFLSRTAGGMLGRRSEKDRLKKLKAYANASHPVLTPDLTPDDARRMPAERGLGVQKLAGMDEPVRLSDVVSGGIDTAKGMLPDADSRKAFYERFLNIMPGMDHPLDFAGMMRSAGDQGLDPRHLAIGAGSAVVGTALGWKLAARVAATRARKRLDKRIATARREMDRLFAEEMARTRGLGKEGKRDRELGGGFDRGIPRKQSGSTPSFVSGAGKMMWLYAALAAVSAHMATKGWMDRRDPARARLKAIKQYAAERAVVKDAPVFLAEDMGLGDSAEPSSADKARPPAHARGGLLDEM